MRIGLDLDSVVADFTGHVNTLYEPWFGEPCPIVWDTWDAYKMSHHFTDWPTFQRWADRAMLWETMPFMPGAQAGIDTLQRAGHRLTFLTARKGVTCENQTRTWFFDRITRPFGIPVSELHVNLGGNKASVPCDIYVDDSPTELAALKAAGKLTVKFKHPWNKGYGAATVEASSWHWVVSQIWNLDWVTNDPEVLAT